MIKNILFGATLFLTMMALASGAESAHRSSEELVIPLEKIGWQAANLGVLLILLFYFAKKSIVDFFAKRKTDFIDQSEKTKALLLQAEASLKEVKKKLSQLESGESKALETARHEANLIKANLIKDAEAQAHKMKNDVELTIKNELLKAKEEINQIILKEAIAAAKEKLSAQSPQGLMAIESQFLIQVDKEKASQAGL